MSYKNPEKKKEYNSWYQKNVAPKKKIRRNCEFCSKEFEIRYYERTRKNCWRFCSQKCKSQSQRIETNDGELIKLYIEEKLSIPDISIKTGVKWATVRKRLLDSGIILRNQSDSLKLTLSRNPERHVGEQKKKHYCKVCKEIVYRSVGNIKPLGVFCSKECFDIFQTLRAFELRYGKGWHNAKREMRKKFDCCSICGLNRKDNRRELDVHHVVPMRFFNDKLEANKLKNLIVVCPKCHTTIDNEVRKYERTLRDNGKQPNTIDSKWEAIVEEARNRNN